MPGLMAEPEPYRADSGSGVDADWDRLWRMADAMVSSRVGEFRFRRGDLVAPQPHLCARRPQRLLR